MRLGEYPLYSADWHGISLSQLAGELGLPPSELANQHFYQKLYERWRTRDFEPEPSWLNSKKKMADIFHARLGARLGPGSRVLSLGAGLGIVEYYLCQRGVAVDLQECQDAGFSYLERIGRPPDMKLWITHDFTRLPEAAYDGILAISLVYALRQAQYHRFFEECRRILRVDGWLLLWDHDARMPLALLKRRLKAMVGYRDVFWGWIRTPQEHTRYASQHSFRLEHRVHFDAALNEIRDPLRLAGLQLPWGPSLGQLLIFRRI